MPGVAKIDGNLGIVSVTDDWAETIARCHALVSKAYMAGDAANGSLDPLLECIETIEAWAYINGVDMEAVLRATHEYNKTRPYRHGGKKL